MNGNISIKSGLAATAGGIDPQGASRAIGAAAQVIDEQLGKAVAQEQVRMESTDKSKLNDSALYGHDPDTGEELTEEYRMGAAGMVAKEGSMAEKIRLFRALPYMLKEARSQARAANPGMSDEQIDELPEVRTVRYIQKQAHTQAKELPFAIGDTALDGLRRGDWEGDFDADFANRIGRKLTGGKLPTLKIEEYEMLEAASAAGAITGDRKVSLDAAVREAQTNAQVRRDMKPEMWAVLERIDPAYMRPTA